MLGPEDTGNIYVEGVRQGEGHDRIGITPPRQRGKSVYHRRTWSTVPIPTVDPSAPDMLGVVAYSEINIADNGAALFKVNGSLYSYSKGVTVENYNSRHRESSTRWAAGSWRTSMPHQTVLPGSGRQQGATKCIVHYDERFRTSAPPYLPDDERPMKSLHGMNND